MTSIPVYNSEGKEVDTLKIDAGMFEKAIKLPAIYQAINAYRANQRKGTASTKTMGEVSGGGKKPWRQKGTGRARVGSIRSPLWRHGGVVFGPHPRDYSVVLPKKINKAALLSAVNTRLKENNIVIIDEFSQQYTKTKELAKMLGNLKLSGPKERTLLLTERMEEGLKKSSRNIPTVKLMLAQDLNPYEVLASRKLVFSKKSFQKLIERLKK